MQQKFSVGIVTFSYGGNGGISSEVPDIREWMIPTVLEAHKDERISGIRIWNLSDTPITMTRNKAVLMAREHGVDVLVMVDSDMKPDVHAGSPDAKPFFKTSFDFLVNHYNKGPCVIGAPYCGPPPVENVYVFRWNSLQSEHPNPDFQLEFYDRHTAMKMAGIQDCAALPTGLIMYDMRAFELTEPKESGDNPWFYYEWRDRFAAEKASTEDVTMTRDLSLVGTQKLGYNPVYCNWDSWAGHWKPKCVGKPQVIDAAGVSAKLKTCWEANVTAGTRLVNLEPPKWLKIQEPKFDGMGMELPVADAAALSRLITEFCQAHGRSPHVCEVGSWAGRSAILMARAGATVTCVDHWEGSKNDAGCQAYDGSRGTPFEVFCRNTAEFQRLGKISYLKSDSEKAADWFTEHSVLFDIVYIDAEHDYESVKRDIALWKPLCRHVLAGHDFHVFSGVSRAVSEAFKDFSTEGNVWRAKVT